MLPRHHDQQSELGQDGHEGGDQGGLPGGGAADAVVHVRDRGGVAVPPSLALALSLFLPSETEGTREAVKKLWGGGALPVPSLMRRGAGSRGTSDRSFLRPQSTNMCILNPCMARLSPGDDEIDLPRQKRAGHLEGRPL